MYCRAPQTRRAPPPPAYSRDLAGYRGSMMVRRSALCLGSIASASAGVSRSPGSRISSPRRSVQPTPPSSSAADSSCSKNDTFNDNDREPRGTQGKQGGNGDLQPATQRAEVKHLVVIVAVIRARGRRAAPRLAPRHALSLPLFNRPARARFVKRLVQRRPPPLILSGHAASPTPY